MLPKLEELTGNELVDSEEDFFASKHWISMSTVMLWLLELLKIMGSTNATKWPSTNGEFILNSFTKHFTFNL
jgi:hypothetical protein